MPLTYPARVVQDTADGQTLHRRAPAVCWGLTLRFSCPESEGRPAQHAQPITVHPLAFRRPIANRLCPAPPPLALRSELGPQAALRPTYLQSGAPFQARSPAHFPGCSSFSPTGALRWKEARWERGQSRRKSARPPSAFLFFPQDPMLCSAKPCFDWSVLTHSLRFPWGDILVPKSQPVLLAHGALD